MKVCEYGCGQEAKVQFQNGKWCCSKHWSYCLAIRKKNSIRKKKEWKDLGSGYNSISWKKKQSEAKKKLHKDPNSKYNSDSYKEKVSNNMKKIWEDLNTRSNLIKLTIERIRERYPTFTKEEEMRYNPTKPLEEREIQVHCKNHECENSKDKNGWFTPTKSQLSQRIRAIERSIGFGESNFYCSQYCRDICSLYNVHNDPYKNKLPYTLAEYNIWRQTVLELDKSLCQFCGKKATHVHHIKPVKTHPHLALDPDNGISFCEECHYKIGHRDECSTGNLAKIIQQGCALGS